MGKAQWTMDLPFLHQTTTLLRLGAARATRRPLPRRRPHQIRKVTADSGSLRRPSLAPHQQQQAHDAVDPKTKFFQLQAERRAAAAAGQPEPELPGPAVTSTITPEEQRAFARLHELALRQQAGLPPLESGRLNVNPETILALFAGPPQRYQQLETVATRRSSSRPAEDVVAKFCSDQMRDYYRSFNEALHSTTLSRDVAAFSILQKQIFPLLELITPPSPSAKPDPASSSRPLNSHIPDPMAQSKKPRAKKSKTSRSVVNDAILSLTATATTPTTASPLDIVSRLYPAATLLALRLLTKHQPLSPITSSLLSTIRDLGPTSYVLAANTHFYNTFLFLRWNVSSSLCEICTLLSEMERGAVEFDRGTAAFLADVAEERARDFYTARSDDGAGAPAPDFGVGSGERRGAQWWRKQPQEKWWPRVEEWRLLISRRLDSNGITGGDDDSMRARPYSSLMSQRAEDDVGLGQWARKVWL
ncbi:hypothetical protein DV738_g1450, partial [Chaetothyriales sp. CBS 135597]